MRRVHDYLAALLLAEALTACPRGVMPESDGGSDAPEVGDVAIFADSYSTAWWTGHVSLLEPAPGATLAGMSTAGIEGWLLSAQPPDASYLYAGALLDGCWVEHWQGVPAVDGGTLTVGDRMGTTSAHYLAPDPYVVAVERGRWSTGDVVHIAASGATFPAFASDVVFPAAATVVRPLMPAGGAALTVRAADALTVAWSGGGANQFVIALGATAGTSLSAPTVRATCRVNAQVQSFQLSPRILALANGMSSSTLEFSTQNIVVASAGEQIVELRAEYQLWAAPLVVTSP